MSEAPDSTLFAVQSAVVELFDSIEYVTKERIPEEVDSFKNEAQRTVLMLIAAIAIASRQYRPGEWPFLSALVDWQDLPGGEARYINDYATKWRESASKQVPKFFETALQYDLRNCTAITGAMLREIQRIGRTVCAFDGAFTAPKREIVRSYISFLEEVVAGAKGEAVATRLAPEGSISGIQSDIAALELESAQVQSVPPVIPPPIIPSTTIPRRQLHWVLANETVTIGSFQIPSGMIYISDGQAGIAEASTINLQLPIGRSGNGTPLNYYPNYAFITPEQRYTYLEWLAAGRKDTNPEKRELGYVFLFFYGLERRLLLDKVPDQEVVAELVRLLDHYGPYTHSRSLHSYTSQLIHFWGYQQGLDYYSQLLDWMKTLPISLISEDDLAITLSSFAQTEQLIPPELAYEAASHSFEARRSIVVSRVNKEFRSLFAKRYAEQFSQGFKLNPPKRIGTLYYRPASPTLLYDRNAFYIKVPDIDSFRPQFKPLTKIWNSCVDDLSGYSRAKSKGSNASGKLKAFLALPEELRAGSSHPLTEEWTEILSGARKGTGCSLLEIGTVAHLVDLQHRETLTPTQSREVAQAIESLGYEVEPDARYDGAYAWDQEVAVYKRNGSMATAPSQNYKGASVLLKLCVLIAGADGHIAPEELELSRHLIEKHLTLSDDDKQRLEALKQVLVADPLRVKGFLTRIAAAVPKDQRELICESLVYVASADNVATKDEVRALERIFKVFGIPHEKLENHLKSACDFKEVTIQESGSRIPGEAIPVQAQPFRINMARVDEIAKETSEVIGILSKVMVEDDVEPSAPAKITTTTIEHAPQALVPGAAQSLPTTPEWMKSLDSKFQQVLLRLIEQDSWARSEFELLAKKLNLMPLNAFDAINEWADEKLGDFLLEGDDPIMIHKEIIP